MMNVSPDAKTGCPFLSATTVVMPALDEAECVAGTVRAWLSLGAARVRVIDNGSADATAAVARNAGAEAFFEPRRGYGAAAWRGLQDWNHGSVWVLFSSADGSDRLTPEESLAWQAAIDSGADMIVGNRVAYPGSRAHLNRFQKLGNRITCGAIRLGWKRTFHDMGSLRLLRRDALVDLGLRDRAFGWNVEMQIRALESRWNIIEIPVHYLPRSAGESKISGNLMGTIRAGKGILRMLWLLWNLRRASHRQSSLARLAGEASRPVGSA